MRRYDDWLPATRGDLRVLWDYVLSQTDHITRMGEAMAKNDDALAELDAQLDELEAYVLSDDETDAAEVQQRTERLRGLLAQVKGPQPGVPEGEVPAGGTEVTNPTPGAQDNPSA
jgi:hypothetical protein